MLPGRFDFMAWLEALLDRGRSIACPSCAGLPRLARQRTLLSLVAVLTGLMAGVLVQSVSAQDQPTASALVIELTVDARDTVPLESTGHGSDVGPPAWVEGGKAFIHPMALRRLHRTDADAFNLFPHQVRELDQTQVLLIVTRNFLGNLRQHSLRTMSLRRDLPVFPIRPDAEIFVITPIGFAPVPESLIPWPNLRWSIAEAASSDQDGSAQEPALLLDGPAGEVRLQPGESHKLATETETLPVVLRRFKPAKVGETEPLEMEEFDLETADFTADVTIHFYGRLPLEAAE